jgi:DNA-binding CsgD family transcriptional regulator
MADEPVGRTGELGVAAEFVATLARGPALLVLEGEPGIGKTTVWRAAVTLAENGGYRVLSARPAQPDQRLSFVGLADLLAEVGAERVAALPEPQRVALDAALLRRTGPAPEQRAVFTAVLSVMTALASETPVVLAVDDLQWLDPPSAHALAFVARRTRTHSIGLLVASRDTDGGNGDELLSASDHGWTKRLKLRPMTLAGIQRLLKQRLERTFSRPTLRRIHDGSAGNPFFALEIARALGTAEPVAGEPLPAPEDLRLLVRSRVERLPPATRRGLLRMAALSQPTVALIGSSLAQARREGLIEKVDEEGLVFTHPLYASAVYESASPEERRRTHLSLARKVADVEEQARHLALGSTGPDKRVASALDRAAKRARSRGAPETAGELWELSVKLTPPGADSVRRRRILAAADAHLVAGATARARELLSSLVDELPPGDERSGVLVSLTDASLDWDEMGALADRAVSEAASDSTRARALTALAWVRWPSRDIDFAVRLGRVALMHAERAGDPALLVETLGSLAFWELQTGRPTEGFLARAIEAEDESGVASAGLSDPRFTLALQRLYQGRLDEARVLILRLREEAAAEGNEPVLVLLGFARTHLELTAGKWLAAAAAATEAHEVSEQIGPGEFGGMANFWKGLVAVHFGREAEARSAAETGARLARRAKQHGFEAMCLCVVAFLELSLGNDRAALANARPALDSLTKMKQAAATNPAGPYALGSLIAAGEPDEAARTVERLLGEAARLESPLALARATRYRGQLAAADGNLAAAQAALDQSLEQHEGGAWPFERAQTLLALGRIQRRARAKAAAKKSLERALAIFEELPAPLWAEQARDELARIGLRRAAPNELTEAERRVAELAATGLTNREVAARLHMSAKTVEANLTRAYRKLGIHSRAELGARLGNMGPKSAQT